MPSLLHETIIALVRERPELAAHLLRELLHVALPNFTEARLAEASLNDLVPTEYLAVLSAMAHGRDPIPRSVAAASAAAAGAAALPEPLRMLCLALIESCLG
jgi:hypothetical protein